MAENAQTLTRKESAARAGDGQGRQKQGRVTDAEGERSVLARGLRRPKADPATGSAGTWRNLYLVISVGREVGFGVARRLSPSRGSAGDSGSMERGDWVRKVVCRPDVLAIVVGRVLAGKPAILAAVP